MMPLDPCERCLQSILTRLDSPSASALVDYYRCDSCGHVFHVPQGEPNAARTNVTTYADDPPENS